MVNISSSHKKKIGQLITAPIVDSFYDGCGVTKICFGATNECLFKRDCSSAMAVKAEGSKYIFEMKAKKAVYVAVGLSNDKKMVNCMLCTVVLVYIRFKI